jgi:ATP-dependent RNA helicase DeaD
MTTGLLNPTETPAESVGFASLHLSEPVQRALDEIGYSDPTPVQAATYPLAITGRDMIVQARTGTGKTAAFGIPLVDKLVTTDRFVQALVLAPTRELAVQSQREIARLGQYKGLHTVAIYGGAPMGKQIEELQSGAQIVSGTPGRVLDHLRRGTLQPDRLRVLVLDEMDEMLSMGFAKELNAILEMIPPRGKRQTMCFSATVDGEVRRHAERHMHEPEMISLSSDAVSAEQITHYAYMVTGGNRAADLVRVLEVEDPESALIFCNMRSETERVATTLQQAGFNADWLNGDLPQRDRERIMEDTRKGKLRYLVATDVAARGIDISHLTHVINYTFPESAAVYVHRTGRTGRAGRTGCAISLVGPEELGRLYYLRLEYKISPVERSLPTSGELKTRAEIDRVALLASAYSVPPNATDLAVARRLLTHPDVERILGGLLHTFFGTRDEIDEEAAAARRTRRPDNLPELVAAPIPPPRTERRERSPRAPEREARPVEHVGRPPERTPRPPERTRSRHRERDPRMRDGEPSTEARVHDGQHATEPHAHDAEREPQLHDAERPREPHARDAERAREPQVRDAERAREPQVRNGERPREPQARDGDRAREARPRDAERAREPQARNGERPREPQARNGERPREPQVRDGERAREARPRDGEPGADALLPKRPRQPLDGVLATVDDDIEELNQRGDFTQPEAGSALPGGLLYLNLGKRDGVRVGEVARLLRESCELSRAEIGRIRVRDRYTFVDVPEERLETIIQVLSGQTLHEKALAPERAKTAKS